MPQKPAPKARTATQSKGRNQDVRPNSVNLKSQALETLLDKLDAPDGNPPSSAREFVRWPFRREAIEVRLIHPGGNVVTIRVACRNISRGGICVLHNSFVHSGSECRVMVPHPTRKVMEVSGTVMRCQHRVGVVHELGISFRTPISTRELFQSDPFSNTFSLEHVHAQELQGRLLLIEPSGPDRSIIRHYLKETRLAIDAVGSLAEAVLGCEGMDAVLASSELPETDPITLVNTIRQCRFTGPIGLIVPNASPETRARVAGLSLPVIIVQPITQDLLLQAMAEMILIEEATPPAPQASSGPSAQWTSSQLAEIGTELYQATCTRNLDTLRDACSRLKNLAESMQWGAIAKLTAEVLFAITSGKTVDQVKPSLDLLMASCESGVDSEAA
jgi:CheY-like chemotaxis protein